MKDFSGKDNYNDFSNLKIRKDFHTNYGRPTIDSKKETIKLIDIKDDEEILDFGCGNGDFLIYLREKGHKGKLTGVDLSKGMIEEAKKLDASKSISFIVADGQNLPFSDASFNVVVCRHVLYHLDSIEKGISEIHRVLKSKGYMCITLNCITNRDVMENFKAAISKSIGNNNFLDNNKRINFENYRNFISGFKILRELKLHRYITLKDPEPIVTYMSSFKDFWDPKPTDEAWKKALNVVQQEVNEIIKKEGTFKADPAWGGVLLQKTILN